MYVEREVHHEGTQYTWTCKYDESALTKKSWGFRKTIDNSVPPRGILDQLERKLIEQHGDGLAEELRETDQEWFYQVMREMGAIADDIDRWGLNSILEHHHPEEARALRFKELPPAGHTPLNSPVVRDWFFSSSSNGNNSLPKHVDCRGSGPFEEEEFIAFLENKGVLESKKASKNAGINEYLPVGVLVIGREGWTDEEIDQVIEDHVCRRELRVYSQEMFLSFLTNGADPFDAGPDVLAAFRAGHPGLEFLSGGWSGWVSTYVSENWREPIGGGGPHGGSGRDSPLKLLGYGVGKSGKPEAERREILRRAFKGRLPSAGTLEVDQEWGSSDSPRRLQKMAQHIAAVCRNRKMQSSEANVSQAIADWESDLDWLKEQFYRGHMKFGWPDTGVY